MRAGIGALPIVPRNAFCDLNPHDHMSIVGLAIPIIIIRAGDGMPIAKCRFQTDGPGGRVEYENS